VHLQASSAVAWLCKQRSRVRAGAPRTTPSADCTQHVCTPWMELTPQSYSGMPSRVMLSLGPGLPPPPCRAVSCGAMSDGSSREIRSLTRSASDSDVSQNGYVSCGGWHARVATVTLVSRTVLAAARCARAAMAAAAATSAPANRAIRMRVMRAVPAQARRRQERGGTTR